MRGDGQLGWNVLSLRFTVLFHEAGQHAHLPLVQPHQQADGRFLEQAAAAVHNGEMQLVPRQSRHQVMHLVPGYNQNDQTVDFGFLSHTRLYFS